MPARGMWDALPRAINGPDGPQYQCATCHSVLPPSALYWTFWRIPGKWLLWPLFRDIHDPNYGFMCDVCRQTSKMVDLDFVPGYTLEKVMDMEIKRRGKRNVNKS